MEKSKDLQKNNFIHKYRDSMNSRRGILPVKSLVWEKVIEIVNICIKIILLSMFLEAHISNMVVNVLYF